MRGLPVDRLECHFVWILRWALLTSIWATGAHAELSPNEAAVLSAGVSIPAIALGAALAVSAAEPNGPGSAKAQFAAGLIISAAGVLIGPDVGRFVSGVPATDLILIRSAIAALGGGFIALRAASSDNQPGSPPTDAVVVATLAGIALIGHAVYDIATTPADIRELRSRPVITPIPGGLALVVPFP